MVASCWALGGEGFPLWFPFKQLFKSKMGKSYGASGNNKGEGATFGGSSGSLLPFWEFLYRGAEMYDQGDSLFRAPCIFGFWKTRCHDLRADESHQHSR